MERNTVNDPRFQDSICQGERPTFTKQQITEFLEMIDMPLTYRNMSSIQPNLQLLQILHTHMISTVPYETLKLHYSPDKNISLHPQHLFQKIVGDSRGRGGYCLEVNLFFLYLLRDLGFQVYPVGTKSRLRIYGEASGGFEGWGHIVLIAVFADESSLGESKWVIDACFGGNGPTKPIRLQEEFVTPNMGTQDVQFVRDFLPDQRSRAPEHKMWLYQCRNNKDRSWQTFYSFSDQEWQPPDFDVINHFTSSSPKSSATKTVCVVKFLRRNVLSGSEVGQEVYGKRILLNGLVKENLGQGTKVIQVCKSEEERIKALYMWFGISLTEEEMSAIKCHITELRECDNARLPIRR